MTANGTVTRPAGVMQAAAGRLHDLYRAVVHLRRHRIGMPVLPTMRERELGWIGEAGVRATADHSEFVGNSRMA
jgi:hypothetical protein